MNLLTVRPTPAVGNESYRLSFCFVSSSSSSSLPSSFLFLFLFLFLLFPLFNSFLLFFTLFPLFPLLLFFFFFFVYGKVTQVTACSIQKFRSVVILWRHLGQQPLKLDAHLGQATWPIHKHNWIESRRIHNYLKGPDIILMQICWRIRRI